MTTTVTKTIGAGGDYSTLALWIAACPSNLVTSDQVWQGKVIWTSSSDELSVAGVACTISGITTDSTRYVELTANTGASFADNANVQTNALRYNSANGACIKTTGSYINGVIYNTTNYFRISKLQLLAAGTATYGLRSGGTNLSVSQMIISRTSGAQASRAVLDTTSGPNIITNSLLIMDRSSATQIARNQYSTQSSYYGCTLVCPSDLTAATAGISKSYSTLLVKNCAIFGATEDVSLSGGATIDGSSANNYTSDSTPSTSFTNVAYDTSTGSGFQNTTSASADFRIKSTSALKDSGVTDATNMPNDIAGTSRPSGSAYDVGCWEFVVSGGSQNLSPSLYSDADTFLSPTVATSYEIAPSLFSDGDTFYSATINSGYNLVPAIFDDTDTFYSPAISASYDVTPSLFNDSDTFYSPIVGIDGGDQALLPTLFSDSDTFYSPTITGDQALLPALFTDTDIFYSPTVTSPGVMTLTQADIDAVAAAVVAALTANPPAWVVPLRRWDGVAWV